MWVSSTSASTCLSRSAQARTKSPQRYGPSFGGRASRAEPCSAAPRPSSSRRA
nr:MAG TPA: hypothetical protein [Caudoviricetes sp.]